MYRERYSCYGPSLLLSPFPTVVPFFCCCPLLLLGSLNSGTPHPKPVVHHFLAPQAISTKQTIVLFPELASGDWISAPSAAWASQAVVSRGCGTNGMCHSLCFALLSPPAALFSKALISLRLGWSPCQLVGLPGFRFLTPFIALRSSGPGPYSFFSFSLLSLFFFSFCSTHYMKGFLPFLEVQGLLPAFGICSLWTVLHVDFFF